jgi:hypothetical protein
MSRSASEKWVDTREEVMKVYVLDIFCIHMKIEE